MAIRKTTRRKTTPVRRRRSVKRGMGAKFTQQLAPAAKGAVGGAVASILERQLSGMLPVSLPAGSIGLIGALVTGAVAPKQRDIALGMAGAAGAQLAASFMPGMASAAPALKANYSSMASISPAAAEAALNSGAGLYDDYAEVTPLMDGYYTQGW